MVKIKTEGERISSTLDKEKDYNIIDDEEVIEGEEVSPLGGSLELYDIERENED